MERLARRPRCVLASRLASLLAGVGAAKAGIGVSLRIFGGTMNVPMGTKGLGVSDIGVDQPGANAVGVQGTRGAYCLGVQATRGGAAAAVLVREEARVAAAAGAAAAAAAARTGAVVPRSGPDVRRCCAGAGGT